MKTLRKIIAGILIGGAFGAKMGAWVGTISEADTSLIYVGLAIGSCFGLILMLSIAITNKEIKQPHIQWSFKKRCDRNPIWEI
ncbi:MAG: hypothetical protein RIM99_13310 [Cyclobacteriaceae bacterium]